MEHSHTLALLALILVSGLGVVALAVTVGKTIDLNWGFGYTVNKPGSEVPAGIVFTVERGGTEVYSLAEQASINQSLGLVRIRIYVFGVDTQAEPPDTATVRIGPVSHSGSSLSGEYWLVYGTYAVYVNSAMC